jgi:hypothetical protein
MIEIGGARNATWEAVSEPKGLKAFGLKSIPEPIGVVAAVVEQPLHFWQVVQHRCCANVVAVLFGGHEEAQGAAVGASDKVTQIAFYPQARCRAVRL